MTDDVKTQHCDHVPANESPCPECVGAREWSLPLMTLIVNSDFQRPGDVHVIRFEDFEALKKELEYSKAVWLDQKNGLQEREIKMRERITELESALRAVFENMFLNAEGDAGVNNPTYYYNRVLAALKGKP